MQTWFFDSRDPEQTFDHAVELGRSIGAGGLALALVGPLGAGKTVFVKGLAEGLGVDPRLVSSPTFVIAQQYPIPDGPETLHHVDLYRLESALELESIGFDDMLRDGQVIAVEWADRFPDLFGREFLTVEFEGPSPEEEDALREGTAWRGRRARVAACGEDPERVLADWAERIDSEKIPADDVGVAAGTAGHSSREMRLLSMLTLAICAFLLGRFDFDFDFAHPPCDSLLALDEDELGTLHVRCSPGERQTSRPLTGIARLLDGDAIDLNRASDAVLRALPQIGKVRASAIVGAREARVHGRFSSVGDLESISGIGPKTIARIEELLFVKGHDEFPYAPAAVQPHDE